MATLSRNRAGFAEVPTLLERTRYMTDEDAWEPVAREALWQALHATRDDLDAAIESVGSTVYFDRELGPDQVERMRRVVGDLEYVTEAYLAAVCEETEPRVDDLDRAPSWQPVDEGGADAAAESS